MLGNVFAANNTFIGGIKACGIIQSTRSLQTDLHINKILDILNENRESKLYRVCHILDMIKKVEKANGLTQEQAALKLRKLVEANNEN